MTSKEPDMFVVLLSVNMLICTLNGFFLYSFTDTTILTIWHGSLNNIGRYQLKLFPVSEFMALSK